MSSGMDSRNFTGEVFEPRREQPAPGEPSRHTPMTHWQGREIKGLKRCANCGLSETYWERFPTCDSVAQLEGGEKPHADIDYFQTPPEHASREELLGALQYWVRRAKAAENAAWSVSNNVCPNCHSQDEKMRLYNWAIKPIDRCQHVWHDGSAEPASPPAPAAQRLNYEVVQDKNFPSDWRVEAIDRSGDIFVAVFSGPDAERRAREYAKFKS